MKYPLSLICLLFCAIVCQGQRLQTPTLSPASKISQEIGLTEMSIEYARPSAKGRTIFGDLVPFDQMWRTGANASTKITLTEPGRIGGNPIEAGTYAIYTIPSQEKWTIIIHSKTDIRSIAGDAVKPENDVCRFEVKPEHLEHFVETFTIQFSDITSNSCNVELLWENTSIKIPVEVEVDKKIEDQMAEFLKNPATIPHRTYFEAAQYYLHNSKSLSDALNWISAALEKSPENFRYGLLKAKIQDKDGDRKAALETIDLAHQWAVEADNSNYIEQTDIFRKSLKQ